MDEKLMLGNFIYECRKAKNLSQSDLGELVGVSNKAVSKWETLEANPDIQIIPKLAEALGVSIEELMECKKNINDVDEKYHPLYTKGNNFYEYKSKTTTKKGKPLVHLNIGFDSDGRIRKADGIIAIGLIAKGLISIGIFSTGIISLGILSLGILSIGTVSIGLLLALGGISLSLGLSIGGIAIGSLAIGGLSIGILSIGGFATGIWAHTGEFGKAIGKYIFFH